MAVTVSTTITAATVSSIKPRVSVQFTNPQTQVVTVAAAADIAYIYLAVDAQLDVRGLYPVIFDAFAATDVASLGTDKPLTDAAASSDALQPFEIGKGSEDTATSSEQLASDLNKPRTDFGLTSDQSAIGANKPLADQFTRSDSNTLHVGLVKADIVPARDGSQESQNYASADYFADKYAMDVLPLLDVSKLLSDSLIATDDFGGELTVDDDQTMSLMRSISESASVLEALGWSLDRGLADAFAASDQAGISLGRGVSDSISRTDVATPSFGKASSDTADASDNGSLYMTDYADISYFAEAYVGTYQTF